MKQIVRAGPAVVLAALIAAAVSFAHATTTAAPVATASPTGATPAATAPPAVAAVTPKRPRIGLALSGGGARGIAHVGVIKVLEEMRIPISCVTGTSMGSIVGGTFAAGRTPAEMEELVLAADWEDIFRDRPPREEIAVQRKLDDYKTLFAPEFGVKDGSLTLPKGAIAGVAIETLLRSLTSPAFGITNFNKLPIPFRAVATDIETGDAVVLNHGSLAQAMRASMSIPAAISPVEIDGKLLVDGMIADNLPINVARKLCGDVIIAVNIGTPPMKRGEITSALSVVAQMLNFLGMENVDKQLKSLGPDDVLIAPDLGDISTAKFDRSKDAIRIGEEATRAMADKLKRYSLPPEQFAALRKTQVAQDRELGVVDEIRIEGLEKTNPAVALALVESKPGEPLTEEKIGADLRRIYGTKDYESISYRIVGGETGPRAMVIEPKEKSWGSDYLRFGLALSSDFSGDNQFNALVQYRSSWLNKLGGELEVEGQVGQNTHLYGQFYQPLTESAVWFVAPNAYIGQQIRSVFQGNDKIAEYLVSAGSGALDFGANLGTWGQMRVGPVWTKIYARPDTGASTLPSMRQTTSGMRASLFVDQTDAAWFPHSGYAFGGTAYAALTSLGSAVNYQKLEGTGRIVKSWGPHTINLAAAGGTGLGSDMPPYETFTLGGPLKLSGFRINQLSGREYAFGRAMYYNRFMPLPDIIGSGVYVGGSAEVGWMTGNNYDTTMPKGTLWSASAFLGADTFLGPAYLGAGIANQGRWNLYLLLGAP